jgi:hypothetical protein
MRRSFQGVLIVLVPDIGKPQLVGWKVVAAAPQKYAMNVPRATRIVPYAFERIQAAIDRKASMPTCMIG